MEPFRARAGLIASVLGIVGFASVVALAIFFAVGGPFGSINDWTIGAMGILTAILVIGLDGGDGSPGDLRSAAGAWPALAVVGSAIVVVGAGLVISRTTGFLLAGLVESFGFALVGSWLVVRSRDVPGAAALASSRLARLGIVAGALMAMGIVVAPAILMGLDDIETAPAWVWIGFVGWLGIFFLFPAWSLSLGITLRRRVSTFAAREVA